MEYGVCGPADIIVPDAQGSEYVFHNGFHVEEIIFSSFVRISRFFRTAAEETGEQFVFIGQLCQGQFLWLVYMARFENRHFLILLGQVVHQGVHKSRQEGCPHIRIFFGNGVHNGDSVIHLVTPGEIQLFQVLLVHEAVVHHF